MSPDRRTQIQPTPENNRTTNTTRVFSRIRTYLAHHPVEKALVATVTAIALGTAGYVEANYQVPSAEASTLKGNDAPPAVDKATVITYDGLATCTIDGDKDSCHPGGSHSESHTSSKSHSTTSTSSGEHSGSTTSSEHSTSTSSSEHSTSSSNSGHSTSTSSSEHSTSTSNSEHSTSTSSSEGGTSTSETSSGASSTSSSESSTSTTETGTESSTSSSSSPGSTSSSSSSSSSPSLSGGGSNNNSNGSSGVALPTTSSTQEAAKPVTAATPVPTQTATFTVSTGSVSTATFQVSASSAYTRFTEYTPPTQIEPTQAPETGGGGMSGNNLWVRGAEILGVLGIGLSAIGEIAGKGAERFHRP